MCEPVSGKFYWVKTAHDPDASDEWLNKIQPALFFNGRWHLIGTEDAWPVVWVGSELVKNEK